MNKYNIFAIASIIATASLIAGTFSAASTTSVMAQDTLPPPSFSDPTFSEPSVTIGNETDSMNATSNMTMQDGGNNTTTTETTDNDSLITPMQ